MNAPAIGGHASRHLHTPHLSVLPLRQVAAPPQGTQQLLQTAHAIPNRRIKRDLTVEQKVAVSEVVQERARGGGRTLTIRLYDKLAAMAHLAKLLNLLVDRQEKSGRVEVTDHRARIMDRLNAIAKRQAPDNDGASGSA